MILTGPEITTSVRDGRLRVTPFEPAQVNPNSYNVRLGPTLMTYVDPIIDAHRPNPTSTIEIGPKGHVLQPNELYLGHTQCHPAPDRTHDRLHRSVRHVTGFD